jgi:hypothetical protein
MNQQIPPPFVCALFGTTAGAIAGGCQTFPICVGAATGGVVGFIMCIALCINDPLPIAKIVVTRQEPIIVNHIHIYELSGASKEINPTPTNTESDGQSK